jgi:mannose-6-phosphate isomerase-like protein (cupin superfamily)
MMRNMVRKTLASLGVCALFLPLALAQTTGDRIDLYFGDWNGVNPHKVYGALEERDILTRGDALKPTQKSAVLRYINSYTYATLAPRCSTSPTRLNGQQEIYFVLSGQGALSAGGENADLSRNIAVLVPANLEFTIKNTGEAPLTMYVINEPAPTGFRPNSSILVRDENKLPITSTDGHWSDIVKTLFVTQDGLGTLESVLTVTLDPLTIDRPHLTDHEDIEEVWTVLSGTSLAFVGNQLRRQTPGMAFLHIPDNRTPHANVNYNEDHQVRFLYFARYHPHQLRP